MGNPAQEQKAAETEKSWWTKKPPENFTAEARQQIFKEEAALRPTRRIDAIALGIEPK